MLGKVLVRLERCHACALARGRQCEHARFSPNVKDSVIPFQTFEKLAGECSFAGGVEDAGIVVRTAQRHLKGWPRPLGGLVVEEPCVLHDKWIAHPLCLSRASRELLFEYFTAFVPAPVCSRCRQADKHSDEHAPTLHCRSDNPARVARPLSRR